MIQNLLKSRFRAALDGLVESPDDCLDLIRPAQNASFGDYQANMAMPLGKTLGKPPREVAAAIVERLQYSDFLEPPEIAGPGFINLRLKTEWLADRAAEAVCDERLGVVPAERPETVVVDFSSPNVAKPMHVGHIRSTVIGNALVRTFRFLGHKVVADNHLGDWGTQFGMVIYGFRHFTDENVFEENPICELGRLYRLVRQLMDYQSSKKNRAELEEKSRIAADKYEARRRAVAELKASGAKKPEVKAAESAASRLKEEAERARDKFDEAVRKIETVESDPALLEMADGNPEINAAVLRETALLHQGDADNIALWKRFLPYCIADIDAIYDEFGVTFDTTLGESFYHAELGKLVDKLIADGTARESDGAICIFVDGFETPMLIRKKDGAFLYATTDLATIDYRERNYHPDRVLYVVDSRQALHFNQLFTVAKQLGYGHTDFEHIKFGTILGDDGRPFRTRSGDTVGLGSLLDEAKSRAYAIVSENDDQREEPQLSEEDRRKIARDVGIGALVYSDLAQNRESDYVFSYDRMLAMTGNTAAYMQYACARVKSIFTRGGIETVELEKKAAADKGSVFRIDSPQERALVLELLKFSDAVASVARDYRPNQLTSYLFDLANCYSAFFEKCPVLRAEDEAVKTSRLILCDLTAKILEKGLDLLGIRTVDRM